MKLLLSSLSLVCLGLSAAQKQLVMPSVIDADETTTPITLDLDWLTISPGFETVPFETRALGGSVPGPTIKISAGTTLKIKFRNLLTEQKGALSSFVTGLTNGYQDPDTGNLHFHGPHVSSILPADDTTLVVPPGQEYVYEIPFAANHMPGTYWVHPHHHGSSALHLGGGAALALVVKDPPGYLPPQIENAQDTVLVFQDWDIVKLIDASSAAGDARFNAGLRSIEGGKDIGQRFVTVNGMYQPTLTIVQGEWQRWRVLYAGWQDLTLELSLEENGADCEMHLLAKDGIYINDYPRSLADDPTLPVPPGGRADVMIKCSNVGSASFSALTRRDTLTLQVVESNTTSTASAAEAWVPDEIPEYLEPVMGLPSSSGCDCDTKMDGYDDTSRINFKMYKSGNVYMHSSYLGAVVTRQLAGIRDHSYHQHVHPFQLVSDFEESTYFKKGDWHDTIFMDSSELQIKYRPVELPGKVMVHCHNALHADSGMMAKEYVRDVESGSCTCDAFGPIEGEGIVDDVETAVVVGGRPPIEVSAAAMNHQALSLIAGAMILLLTMV
eukprot:CAMPEP_0197842830 /NCGR_PEP_ID=MMETSP1437-20131217/46962_1 /TAXON_ID=49252 ORGANISM="Eucampia antarctica, Strain CCMP1452" /NCGR_SAMPLE_ID=MMETSP1437 /ASSEMBLY_ACC=CAM_ASM_001096 /LENGTH=553 /DNA_ID=CAMNT_0043452767 /DNA_START=231 /DNA_END=1892 /DNA_ORIENTATION=+